MVPLIILEFVIRITISVNKILLVGEVLAIQRNTSMDTKNV